MINHLQIHDYPESWVWWVREKAISIILEKALTPNDPDSPIIREEVIPKKKGLKKKKGMPFYSPLKMDRSQTKKKTTSKHSKGKKHNPLGSKKSTSKHAKDKKATKEGSRPSGARRKVDFEEDVGET